MIRFRLKKQEWSVILRDESSAVELIAESPPLRIIRFPMAKVFTIPVPPKMGRKRRERSPDPRYVDGQRLLVEAMKYLAQSDPVSNRSAVELLSEHVRTRFRMTDSPLS